MIRWMIPGLAGLAIIIIAITVFLSPDSLMKCSEKPSNEVGCRKADAIIAVSGGNTTARTQEAINLYKNGWADRLIFSGAAFDTSGPSNAEVMRDQALSQGVPRLAITIEGSSTNTKENAKNTNDILQSDDISSAIVVTSRYHAKRVMLEFHSLAPNIYFRSHPTSSDRNWSNTWWLTPYGWYLSISELIKIAEFYTRDTSV